MRFQSKQKGIFLLLTVMAFMLSGCLPKEEVLPDAPVIKTTEIKDYKKVEVIRGDIIDSIDIDCIYTALYMQDLKFNISQLPIGHVYVKEGDRVTKGDVLADLEMEDIDKRVKEYSENLELLNLKLENQYELKKLVVLNNTQLKQLEGYTKAIENQYTSEIAVYDNEIEKMKDNIYIVEKRFEASHKDLEDHRITAGMDGIVSYVSSFNKGDISNKDLTYITIYNPEEMFFLAEGVNLDKLKENMEVTVNLSTGDVQAVVLNSNDLEVEGITEGIYLKLLNGEEKLRLNDRGRITLILNEVKDVLYLPISVVHEEKGKSIVYVEDEDGFKSIKEIETGLVADRKIEILSGLMEGESVILE